MGYNVAIDGPAGAGKSTIAKLVAKEKGYVYVDTGAMYRGLAIHFLENGIEAEETGKIVEACKDADVTIRYEDGQQQVYLNGKNITAKLREEVVGNMASKSSAIPEVRAKLLELQRELARREDVIMDGRDIGTCVLPVWRPVLSAAMMSLWRRVYLVIWRRLQEILPRETNGTLQERLHRLSRQRTQCLWTVLI